MKKPDSTREFLPGANPAPVEEVFRTHLGPGKIRPELPGQAVAWSSIRL